MLSAIDQTVVQMMPAPACFIERLPMTFERRRPPRLPALVRPSASAAIARRSQDLTRPLQEGLAFLKLPTRGATFPVLIVCSAIERLISEPGLRSDSIHDPLSSDRLRLHLFLDGKVSSIRLTVGRFSRIAELGGWLCPLQLLGVLCSPPMYTT